MSNKYIMITGATGGLGHALALQLSRSDNNVVLVGRDQDQLKKVVQEIRGENNISIPYDLCDLEHIEDIFIVCHNQGIKLDALIHCAGINKGSPIKVNDIDIMEKTMKTNIMSFVELGKHFCKKRYSNDGSSIVAISSAASQKSVGGMCVYSASKAALNSVVGTMARENIKRKIRVNAILPGYLEAAMHEEILPIKGDSEEEYIKEVQPLGRIEYMQIGYLVEFLISDKALYMTGSLIPVTGGQ